MRRIFCMPAKHCIFYPVLLCSRSSLCWAEWSLLWWVWQAPWSSAFFYTSTLRTQSNRMKIRVGGQSLECTVTLLQGHLSRMHSVENLICLSNGKRVAWKIFRWWKIVLQVLAFVNGGCIHSCLGFSIHQGNANIWPYVVLIHLTQVLVKIYGARPKIQGLNCAWIDWNFVLPGQSSREAKLPSCLRARPGSCRTSEIYQDKGQLSLLSRYVTVMAKRKISSSEKNEGF